MTDDSVVLTLLKTGVTITTALHSRFLSFKSLEISDQIPNEEPYGTINVLGIVGIVQLGPGYLILITSNNKVFNYKEVDIWSITKTLILPLRFEIAKNYFGVTDNLPSDASINNHSDHYDDDTLKKDDDQKQVLSHQTTSKDTPNDNNDDNNDDRNDKNDDINDKEASNDTNTTNDADDNSNNNVTDGISSDTSSNFVQQVSKTRDVLFSKIGIFADDLKSTASLSLSKKPALQRNSDYYDEYYDGTNTATSSNISDEPLDINDNSSFRMRRSITLRSPTISMNKPPSGPFYKDISKPMLVKFEKQLRAFFNNGDFYYSNQVDLSKTLIFENDTLANDGNEDDDGSFWFNKSISKKFHSTELSKHIIQGFINSIDIDLNFSNSIASKRGHLLLLSKRSTKRAGLRYLRRGIDDDSNVANYVKTSQIFILDNAVDEQTLFTKFDILRGSIPLFFQQNPANLKPVPYLTRKPEDSIKVFQKHFNNLKQKYGSVSCVSLVERSKRENEIGEAYFKLCSQNDIEISWFDFHKVCKNMNFDNVVQLLDDKLVNSCDLSVEQQLMNYGWYDSVNQDKQLGIFRINCIDCLDRTNLVQKFISEYIMKHGILEKYCLSIERPDLFQKSYNNLWADNGDYISRQYASTNALKGDYTRTSKRNYKGLMTDAWLTMSRYYSGYISDFFKQCFIEYLLGYNDHKIFEDFESTLNVIDPNDLNENLNKKNSYLKNIIKDLDLESDDVIIVGSWNGFESSLKFNQTKLVYNDIAMILTNKMIYYVKHTDGVIDDVVKFSVFDVSEVTYGAYFKSTHTSLSTNPKRNVGLKFTFKRDYEDEPDHEEDFLTVKFPVNMEYSKMKYIINLISKTCVSATLQSKDIISLKEAQKKTNVLDVLEYRFKKMVWG